MGRQRPLANPVAQQVPTPIIPAPVAAPKFAIKWKVRPEPIEIELDRDLFTFEDMLDFTDVKVKVDAGEMSERQMLEALGGVLERVSGQDVRKLPSWIVMEMISALTDMAGGDDLKN